MPDVLMPRLTDSMQEGTILRWLKQTGDSVSRGEHIVEVETDKANTSCEATADGMLQVAVAAGATVAVDTVIATIGDPVAGASGPIASSSAAAADRISDGSLRSRSENAMRGSGTVTRRVTASPVARRLARQHLVDLRTISGTGPNGRVVKADVLQAATAAAARPQTEMATHPPAPDAAAGAGLRQGKGRATALTLTRAERTIARRMAESRATIPDFSLCAEADMSAASALRSQIREVAGDPSHAPTLNDFIVKACGLALARHPRVNSSYADDSVLMHERVNVGVAVAGERTLVVPTIFDADTLTLADIAAETRALAAEVRAGTISPARLANGTFTVSNLGMLGVSSFNAVINPPQAAILAVGAMARRPVDQDGRIALRPAVTLTLTCDHRVLNGADAARFLADVATLLEKPLALLYSREQSTNQSGR